MRRHSHALAAILICVAAGQLPAQTPALTNDLIKDISAAQKKFVALASELSAEQYAWRPAEGVRSSQEILLHVAAGNYFTATPMGVAAPPATAISATDYSGVAAFEKQKLDKAATVAAVQSSFDHLHSALSTIPESRLDEKVKVFGQDFSIRQFMILATTHMHEHLGQLIAYARMNGVAPSWSR